MPVLDIPLHPSKQFFVLMVMVLFISYGIVFTLPIGGGGKILLISLISVYSFPLAYQQVLLKGKNAIVKIHFKSQQWQIYRHNQLLPVCLCKESIVTSGICMLRFKSTDENKKYAIVIFGDSLLPEDGRGLRRQLRIKDF